MSGRRVEPLVISFGKRFAKRFANWKIRVFFFFKYTRTHIPGISFFLKLVMFHSYVE